MTRGGENFPGPEHFSEPGTSPAPRQLADNCATLDCAKISAPPAKVAGPFAFRGRSRGISTLAAAKGGGFRPYDPKEGPDRAALDP
jgi:hypothetical protein